MLYVFGSCLFLCVLFFFVFQLFRKLKGIEENSLSSSNSPKRLRRVEEKSMSNNNAPQIKYDVFVSFRGEIRDGFLSHLIEAFKRNQINAFVDDRLDKGEEVGPSLVGAIEGSSISLIIFSQGYASSCWCLEELVTILECREKYGQTIIPVFYKVKPTDVGHQSSGSYIDAFAKHEKKYESEVQKWRDALKTTAKISGIVSSNRHDAKLVKEIVHLVPKKLVKPAVNTKRLVGIDEKVATLESWIKQEPTNTCVIGIWGMGGLGKTTLAEEVFNKLRYEYGGSYFLVNERDQSSKREFISLKREIFSQLLGYDMYIDTPNSLPTDIVRKIGCTKVFIVLDDVNDSNHIVKLLGTLDTFGSGSRIIVTSRDEQVLKGNKVDNDKIYHLTELSYDNALDLFNLNAFDRSDRQREYNELSKSLVAYARGIPLVVEVLAHLLSGKNKEEWESLLDKLKKRPPKEVYDVMKLNYDDLDYKGKHIFLDLACFFLKRHEPINVGDLKSLLKDNESDNSVAYELGRLKDKALITFSEDNIVSMHDTLQEMAWEIVRQECVEDPGRRSRLWDLDDIHEALENDKVTEAIRSIRIQLPKIKEHKLIPHIFAKMNRLQFLEIFGQYNYDCSDEDHNLVEGIQFLSTELRFLVWANYPLKSLPENFSAEKLVILKLKWGSMEKLWDDVKNLVNLKELDLSQSKELKELPDLSKAINLEVLLLRWCSMLTSVHRSIFSLPKLETLDLASSCLTKLVSDSHLCSLSYLALGGCRNVSEFSVISKNMKELRLNGTKVKTLPSSFEHQSKLELLNLCGSDIEKLPSSINNLTQLLHLDISYCRKFQTIPELPLFLKTLNFSNCNLIQTLPKLPPYLETLNIQDCTSLQTLPELPSSLESLNVKFCTSLQTLPELPLSLKSLDARYCDSLKTVMFPSSAVEQLKENKKWVLFSSCLNLDEHSLEAIGLNAQINVMKFANHHLSTPNYHHVQNYNDYDHSHNHRSYQCVYVYHGSKVLEWLEYKTNNDYVIIDFSSSPPSPQWGFIFCFIIGEVDIGNSFFVRLDLNITITDDEGEGKMDSVRMKIDHQVIGRVIKSDHVCVIYDERCSSFLNKRAKNQSRFKIQVGMWVEYVDPSGEEGYDTFPEVLKGFGVSPISVSRSTYKSVIQQMELRDTN